jgi:uncharacterized repeat protein (TIGR01451 family)
MYSGDQMKFGQTKDNLKVLQGSNNKNYNFFASQINDVNGKLDTTGSFGNSNQKAGSGNKAASRQGWDVTAVDISNQIGNNQKTAYAQGTSTGDSYIINALRMQIEVNSAKPEIAFTGNDSVCEDENITYKLEITNTGYSDSLETVIKNFIPKGTSLVKNSIKINEKAYTDNNNEIKIGTLKNKQVAKVEFKVNVDDKKLTKIENQISLEYGYYMQADSKIQETKTSEKILTNYSEKCESNLPPIAGDDSK